jgi:hypothetical protein
MPKIVISYRRADSEAIAGRIRDRLANEFGADSIFMDIDSVPIGANFRDYIANALRHTDILLAIIGERWLGHREGTTRIQNPSDLVRIEVETALQLGIPVWPVLIGDVQMPSADELPQSLHDLPDFNAAFVDIGRDFHIHMDRLIRQINLALDKSASAASSVPVSIFSSERGHSDEPVTRSSPDLEQKIPAVSPTDAKGASLVKRKAAVAGVCFGVLAIVASVWLLVADNRPSERVSASPNMSDASSGPTLDPAMVKVKSAPPPAKVEPDSAKVDSGPITPGPKKIMLASLDGVPVNLPVPAGFCDLTENEPADKRMLDMLRGLVGKSGNFLLGMYADCEQLFDWRDNKRALLDDYAQYQAQIVPTPEPVHQTCATMRNQGDKILGDQLPDIKARVESTLSNVKVNQTSLIGVLAEDSNACYAAMLQKMRTEVNTDKTQVIVFAIMLVKGIPLFLYRFSEYRRWDTFNALVTNVKGDVAAVIAANP